MKFVYLLLGVFFLSLSFLKGQCAVDNSNTECFFCAGEDAVFVDNTNNTISQWLLSIDNSQTFTDLSMDDDATIDEENRQVKIINLTSGDSYSIKVIYSSNTEKIKDFTISEPEVVTISATNLTSNTNISPGGNICTGNAIELTASIEGGEYKWYRGVESNSIPGKITQTIDLTGIVSLPFYRVEVTKNGCVSLDTFHINVVSTPSNFDYTVIGPELPSDNKICIGTMTTLRAPANSSTVTYTWQIGETPSSGRDLNLADFGAGDYMINLIATSGGCSAVKPLNLEVVTPPTPSITIEGTLQGPTNNRYICQNEEVKLIASGNNIDQYTWSRGSNEIQSLQGGNTLSLSSLSPSSIDLNFTVVVDNGACSAEADTMITIRPKPTVILMPDATVLDGEICSDDAATYTASITDSPNATFRWTTANIPSNPFTIPENQISIGENTYDVEGTDDFGCISDRLQFSLTVNELPTSELTLNSENLCIGDTLTLTPTHTNSSIEVYIDGRRFIDSSIVLSTTNSIKIDSIINIDTQCANRDVPDTIFNANALPTPEIQDFAPPCGASTVEITVEGSPESTYTWMVPPMGTIPPEMMPPFTFTSFQEGDYYVTETDVNGCKNIDSLKNVMYFDKPPPPTFTGPTLVCLDQTNVRYELNGTPMPGVTYSWEAPNGDIIPQTNDSASIAYLNWNMSGDMLALILKADVTPLDDSDGCEASDTLLVTVKVESAPALTEIYQITQTTSPEPNTFLITADPPTVATDEEVCYLWGRDDGETLTENLSRIYYPGLPQDEILPADFYVETWVAATGSCANNTTACRNRTYYTGRTAPGNFGPAPATRLNARLYPNPAGGERTTLEISAPTRQGTVALDIFDLGGRRLQSRTLQLDATGRFRDRISLAGLPAGYYLFLVTDPVTGANRKLPLIVNR